MSQRPIVFVISGRHRPHELMLFVASLLLAVLWLAGIPLSTSLDRLVPPLSVIAWYSMNGFAGVVGLAALYLPWRVAGRALWLELAANAAASGSGAAYAAAILYFGGWRGLAAGLFIVCVWVGGSVGRISQIRRELGELKQR